jgi:hypothetical protein
VVHPGPEVFNAEVQRARTPGSEVGRAPSNAASRHNRKERWRLFEKTALFPMGGHGQPYWTDSTSMAKRRQPERLQHQQVLPICPDDYVGCLGRSQIHVPRGPCTWTKSVAEKEQNVQRVLAPNDYRDDNPRSDLPLPIRRCLRSIQMPISPISQAKSAL